MNETVLTSTGSVTGTVVSTDLNGNVNCVVVGPTTFVRGVGGVFVPTDK